MLLTAPASLGTMYLGIVCEHEREYECTVAVASTITSTSTITITSTDRQQQQYHLNHRSEQVILRPLTLYRTITAGLREFLVCFRFSSVRESYPASTGVAHQTTYDFQKADTWRFFYMFLLLFFFEMCESKNYGEEASVADANLAYRTNGAIAFFFKPFADFQNKKRDVHRNSARNEISK